MLDLLINNWDMAASILFMVAFVVTLMVWQKNGQIKFDLKDVIIDTETGKVSIYKLGQLIAMGVSTWIMVYETRAGRLTEFLFTTYMVTWSGTNLIKKYIDAKNEAPKTQTK